MKMKIVSAQELVAEARESIAEMDARMVEPSVSNGAALIDVREPSEFAAGHLAGAVNIPRGILEFEVFGNAALGGVSATESSRRSRPIVVYCHSGGRAALAAASLKRLGFGNVTSIAGGIVAWEAAGYPTTTNQ